MKTIPTPVFFAVAVALVVAAIVAGLFAIGSPAQERMRRIDQRRVTDLQAIKGATDLYWTRHARLPASLEELTAEPGVVVSVLDPESAEQYGYRPVDGLRYEVCANFATESEEMFRDRPRDIWSHGTGRQCFELDAEDVTRDER